MEAAVANDFVQPQVASAAASGAAAPMAPTWPTMPGQLGHERHLLGPEPDRDQPQQR